MDSCRGREVNLARSLAAIHATTQRPRRGQLQTTTRRPAETLLPQCGLADCASAFSIVNALPALMVWRQGPPLRPIRQVSTAPPAAKAANRLAIRPTPGRRFVLSCQRLALCIHFVQGGDFVFVQGSRCVRRAIRGPTDRLCVHERRSLRQQFWIGPARGHEVSLARTACGRSFCIRNQCRVLHQKSIPATRHLVACGMLGIPGPDRRQPRRSPATKCQARGR